MRSFLPYLQIIFATLLFSQDLIDNNSTKMVEIETSDGNIFLGNIIKKDDKHYTIETNDGIIINIPISSIIKLSTLETSNRNGMIFRADPNKSIYLFAPSSFPIEHNRAYCRNFCFFSHLTTEDLLIISVYSLVLLFSLV